MSRDSVHPSEFRFTGYHMLAIMVAFFGVIISVNLTMAWYATSSWSGLVAQNTYIASQQFNSRAAAMRAMAASGIKGEVIVTPGHIAYVLHERDGSPAKADSVTAHFKRPVGEHEDFQVELTRTGDGRFEIDHTVLAGDWIVEAISVRGGETIMHEATRISVKGSAQ